MNSAEFEKLVHRALKELPPWVQKIIDEENLVVCVREEPGPEVVEEHGKNIFGLFVGLPYGSRRGTYPFPARIEIYRQAFLKHVQPEKMPERVRRTVIHEIAHFMGMDENQVRKKGY